MKEVTGEGDEEAAELDGDGAAMTQCFQFPGSALPQARKMAGSRKGERLQPA